MMLFKIGVALLLVGWTTCKTCSDGAICSEGDTCCQLRGGRYTCCPLANAVCCEDKEHCCPQGYICDNETDACKPSSAHPLLTLSKSNKVKENYVTCGTGDYLCPDNCTCCRSTGAAYSCCPIKDAVCCSDMEHCCPSGTFCDFTRGACTPMQKALVPMRGLKSSPPKHSSKKGAVLVCPDGKTECPEDSTCCPGYNKSWNCCHTRNASCCTNFNYCCPAGSICIVEYCFPPAKPALTALARVNEIVCPDGKFHCPNGYSCCKSPNYSWSCCPLQEAVCCDNHIHWCPKGSICDITWGTANGAATNLCHGA